VKHALDIAYPQLEDGAGNALPVDYDQLASAAYAFWVRWTDYGYWLRTQLPDTQYTLAMQNLQARGVPVGPYMYAGAGRGTSARQQIDDWARSTVVTPTWYPMYDLEETLITGNQLSDWVNEALQRMIEVWGQRPVLYVGPFKPAEWGLERPSVEHWLMVAEYPTTAPYPYGINYEAALYGMPQYGAGPDVPWGVDWDIWQGMSTAIGVPGLAPDRNVDLSLVKEPLFNFASSPVLNTAPPPAALPVVEEPLDSAYPPNRPVVAVLRAA
jgi:hypothetical protein